MTDGNAELNDEFQEIPLKIEIKVKTAEKQEKKTTFEIENL